MGGNKHKPIKDSETGRWTFFDRTEGPVTFENKPDSVVPTLTPKGGALEGYGSTARGRGRRNNNNAGQVANGLEAAQDRADAVGEEIARNNKENRG